MKQLARIFVMLAGLSAASAFAAPKHYFASGGQGVLCKSIQADVWVMRNQKERMLGFQHLPAAKLPARPLTLYFPLKTVSQPVFMHMQNVHFPLNVFGYDRNGKHVFTAYMRPGGAWLRIPPEVAGVLEVPALYGAKIAAPAHTGFLLNRCAYTDKAQGRAERRKLRKKRPRIS